MVLTDMPFSRPGPMESRYGMLKSESSSCSKKQAEEIARSSQEYAAFLKEKERKCGPDGFLDSSRYQHSFQVRSRRPGDMERPRSMSVVDLSLRKDREQHDYDRRLKVIEQSAPTVLQDHMWQHKQQERELKRIEGDIIKNQRSVRKTLREYENSIAKKKTEETKKLHQGMEKYDREQHHHVHKKEELTKQRIEANINMGQSHKDMGRKSQLTTSDLARQYQAKRTAMDLKRIEITRLSKDFERKIQTTEVEMSHLARQYKTKLGALDVKRIEMQRLSGQYEEKLQRLETEQFKLKQELAELAIALNMETQKNRVQEVEFQKAHKKETNHRIKSDRDTEQQLENKLAKSDGDAKTADMSRRKLSADLSLTRGHLQLKQREEGRHLQDTENRLRANISEQKLLNEAALHAELDSKSRGIDQKMMEHEGRRRTQLVTQWRAKKERNETHEAQFREKFKKRYADQQRREHEDGFKFFQKMVTKGEEKEHNLYNKVRNAEYARQKQEQTVRRLQNKLNEMHKTNCDKIKAEMTELNKQEMSIQQDLMREEAQLAKVHAERESSYIALQNHREQLREDKYQYTEHEREHIRLSKVAQKTDQFMISA